MTIAVGPTTWIIRTASCGSEPCPGRICLERIDQALAELQAIRAEVAAPMPAPNGLDADDLIDTTSRRNGNFTWPAFNGIKSGARDVKLSQMVLK